MACAGALVAAGCGGTSQDTSGHQTIRFTWWGNQSRADATQQAIKIFEKKNPGITVQTSFSGSYTAYEQKLATEVAGGGAPDVFQLDYRDINPYGERHVLLNLRTEEAKHNLSVSGLAPSFARTGALDGQQYALPLGQTTQVVVYDPALYAAAHVKPPTPAAPWTWQQYASAAKAITTVEKGKVSGTTDMGWTEDAFETWLREQGKSLYTPDGKFGFTKQDLTAYWNMISAMRASKAATPAQVTSAIDGSIPNEPLARKLSAADFGFDSTFSAYTATTGRALAIAPMPGDNGRYGGYAKPSVLVAASARTAHADAAAKLIDFMVNDPDGAKVLGVQRGLPPNTANRDAVGATLKGSDAQVYAFEKAIQPKLTAAPQAPPKGDSSIQTLIQTLNENVAFHHTSVADAVNQFFGEGQGDLS